MMKSKQLELAHRIAARRWRDAMPYDEDCGALEEARDATWKAWMQAVRDEMTIEAAFAQGARCGHLEGVQDGGEPLVTASIGFGDDTRERAWRTGYEYGYRVGANGEKLPKEYTLCEPFKS